MRKILLVLLVIVISISFVGCIEDEKTAEDKQADATRKLQTEINNQVGMPDVKEFSAKKTLKKIYELQDNSKLICYAYHINEYTGKYIYDGKCMGFPIPYSTQYTNPEQYIKLYASGGYSWQITPQADPDGLYHSPSTSATWITMIDETTGELTLTYFEPNTVVRQTKISRRLCDESTLPKDY